MAKTIFIIDDVTVMLMSVKLPLEMAGYTVETAKDGLEALKEARERYARASSRLTMRAR